MWALWLRSQQADKTHPYLPVLDPELLLPAVLTLGRYLGRQAKNGARLCCRQRS